MHCLARYSYNIGSSLPLKPYHLSDDQACSTEIIMTKSTQYRFHSFLACEEDAKHYVIMKAVDTVIFNHII